QGNGRTNFGRHDFDDLFGSNPRFWRKHCQHASDLGLRGCDLASRHGRQDRRERQQQIGHFNVHLSAPFLPRKIIYAVVPYGTTLFVMVLYGTSVVKEKERVMARAPMSKRRQEGGDEAAVRVRILEAAFAAFMKSGYA